MLEKLGFKKRIHVGISLSANNFLELVCVDKVTKEVVKYSSGNIKYNSAIKEIMDFDEFTEALENLFEDAGLTPSECSVSLNLPNVHFGITSVDSTSETPFIIENLQSEIEDLYIFKRNEPVISYSELESASGRGQKNIIYGAIQTKMIVKLVEIFDNMEADLVRIDTSYSSMLKAMKFCDRFNKYVQKDEKTSILLVTSNSCCYFNLNGSTIVDYIEEPLAVKSFSVEEVYSAITKIITNAISKNNPKSVLIISEADEVNAETLAQGIEFSGEMDFVNKSLSINDNIIEFSVSDTDIDSNMNSYITIEAIGAAVADFDEYPLDINFLPPERINKNMVIVNGYEVDFFRYLLVVLIAFIIIFAIIYGLFSLIINQQTNSSRDENANAEQQIQLFQNNISQKEANQKKDILPILTKILEMNKSVVDVYTALSTDIPESIYIKKFVTNANGGIGILGEASTSESVQEFVKGLREKNGDLMLSKLSINSKNDPVPAKLPDGFTFEIKTSKINISLEDDYLSTIQDELTNVEKTVKTQVQRGTRSSQMTPPPPPIL